MFNDIKKSIDSLSTLVFGLALSIGSLTLINNLASTPSAILNSILLFGDSFIIIIYIWFRYTRIMEIMKIKANVIITLIIILLFCVALEPYLLYLLSNSNLPILNFTSTLFGLDITIMMLVLGILYYIGVKENKQLSKEVLNDYKYRRNILFLSALIFGVAELPIFWNLSISTLKVRFALWALSLFLGLLFRKINSRAKRLTENMV